VNLDLSCVDSAVVGAEPINPAILKRFAAAFAPCGFRREALRPSYGLAESTLMVTASSQPSTMIVKTLPVGARVVIADGLDGVQDQTSRAMVSCGRARLDHRVVVVDPDSGLPCPFDTIGEVWVSGPSVGAGYWNRREETAATFKARLANTQEGSFLRTGDLGFMHNGDLVITGRLKDLIIIRGRNYHPSDIEWTVDRSHPGLRPGGGAAFSISVDGEEKLVVVHETERHHRDSDHEAMAEAIRRAVIEEHDLLVFAVRLVRPGSIPRTSSGKAQRSACRDSYLAGDFDDSHDARMTPIRDHA
jgi:acyl-CoA synthetase (AMP-forming)/AMP-acid ligase II